jgi:hypothetical protein
VFNPTKEFRMGSFFNTSTWRAPLRLIDCWLPTPARRRPFAANEPLANRTLQRFARAGWLGRQTPLLKGGRAVVGRLPDTQGACRVRVLQAEGLPARPGGVRLVISGRIKDVCAELDRLADQESHGQAGPA